jgi:hypothetical protein
VPVTTTITIPDSLRATLYNNLGAREIDGTDTTYSSLAGGLLKIGVPQVIPTTAVPASGDMNVVAAGEFDTAPYSGAVGAGDAIDVNVDDRAGDGEAGADLIADLTTYNAAGEPAGPFHVPCELGDGQVLAIGVVQIIQAPTETTAKIAYKAGKVVNKAVVDAPDSGVAPTGDVKFILKRNGNKVGSKTVALTDAVAVYKVAAPKKGNYKLVTQYLGDEAANFTPSQDDASKSF